MKNILLDKLTKLQKRVSFAKYCFSKGDDLRFVNNVKKIGKEPELVSLEKMESKEESFYYHIYMEESNSGFFADHNRLLAYLYFADYYNLKPVVEYTDKFCYAEKTAVNGRSNPFEYYFCQPEGIGVEELKQGVTCVRSRKENTLLANQINKKQEGYTKSEEYLNEMARITAKYIRLQPEVKEYIQNEISRIKPKKKVLGVHVRGTDFKKNYNGHPVAVTTQEYLDAAKKLVKKEGYEAVFLATDDSAAVEAFKVEFGELLFYYEDVIRSNGKETVMKSESTRDLHHYKLGLEVLRDMYTLASCDGLVAGLSQVSYAARIQKISYNETYDNIEILDKGINYHRIQNCPQ